MDLKIALIGNPNSGKTTLFNRLTGSSQYVGNWPGVTVERKSGRIKGYENIELIDLPGIYSLTPYTIEEVVTREFLIQEKPDVIINIVDSTNLERNLYLTTQVIELNIPMLIALNMTDIIKKNGDQINIEGIKKSLGLEIIEISALKNSGCECIVDKAIELADKFKVKGSNFSFSESLEKTLTGLEKRIEKVVPENHLRWYSIKLFERDEKVIKDFKFKSEEINEIEQIIKEYEKKNKDDSESLIIGERYSIIEKIVKNNVTKKNQSKISISDKIDNLLTHRIFALPIFAAVMFMIYYIAVTTIGGTMTAWVNDVLFGRIIPGYVESFLVNSGTAEWLRSLILDGVLAGVGSVLGFLPQLLVLFFLLSLLEDSGYMTRVVFIMDKIFRNFGLSGKSFIPLVIGSGCSVPGIMASRTIESERDRRITVVTTSFIPCSAKLPIIALIAGALFPGSSWIAPSAYFAGIAAVLFSGIILKNIKGFSGEPASFVMELPPYRLPEMRSIFLTVWDRAKSFIVKAGTVIFLSSGIIWFLSSFNLQFEMVDTSSSILASIGNIVAPIFSPLGWGDWRAAVATFTGLVAKENVVGSLGVLYGFAEVAEDGVETWPFLHQSFTQLAGYSFLMFNLLCSPCVAAIGAIHREMGNGKLTFMAIGYQTLFAYFISLIIYQIGMFLGGNGFTFWTFIGFSSLASIILLLLLSYKETEEIRSYKGVPDTVNI